MEPHCIQLLDKCHRWTSCAHVENCVQRCGHEHGSVRNQRSHYSSPLRLRQTPATQMTNTYLKHAFFHLAFSLLLACSLRRFCLHHPPTKHMPPPHPPKKDRRSHTRHEKHAQSLFTGTICPKDARSPWTVLAFLSRLNLNK